MAHSSLSLAPSSWSNPSTGPSAVGEFGTLVVDPVTGAWIYTLDDRAQSLAQEQYESFQVTVTDEFGASEMATVTIVVTGTNDAAVLVVGDGAA